MVNENKSNWVPVRRIQWLEFLVDSKDSKSHVPEDKLTIFYSVTDILLAGERRLTARGLAKFVGRAVSMLWVQLFG